MRRSFSLRFGWGIVRAVSYETGVLAMGWSGSRPGSWAFRIPVIRAATSPCDQQPNSQRVQLGPCCRSHWLTPMAARA